MANIDGGHYFLTTLIPLKLDPVACKDGSVTSPSHLLREAFAILPTAQQSPACVEAGRTSPFSRCTRTHFVRAALIDQPMYNGRDPGLSLVEGLLNRDLLAHQPVDNLSRPYLMFTADFDARPDEDDGGLTSWAEGLWHRMERELRAVFDGCIDFEHVDDGAAFVGWLRRCQIETTMSFNDYYVPVPDLHGYTLDALKIGLLGGDGGAVAARVVGARPGRAVARVDAGRRPGGARAGARRRAAPALAKGPETLPDGRGHRPAVGAEGVARPAALRPAGRRTAGGRRDDACTRASARSSTRSGRTTPLRRPSRPA